MNESVLNFGPGARLVGVLSAPTGTAHAAERDVGVVFVNAGIIHHVGPNRIHVRLARELAASGLTSLRFDLPGLGDSRSLENGEAIEIANVRAVRDALDAFESRTGLRRIVIFGLCSGSRDAVRTAVEDERVVGVVLIDPPEVLSTRRHRALRVLRAVLDPRKWPRILRGGLRERARWVESGLDQTARRSGAPNPSEMHRLASELLGTLVKRKVGIFLIMTGSRREMYSYRNQFFDVFPELDLPSVTRLEFAPKLDHTFSVESDRRALLRLMQEWIDDLGGSPAPVGRIPQAQETMVSSQVSAEN